MRLRVRLRGVALLVVCAAALHAHEAEAALCVLLCCNVANAPLAFGTYNPVSGSPTLSIADIVVTCSETLTLGSVTVPFSIDLSAGSSGSVSNRTMTGGTTNLPYNIYTSAAYTTVWDNTTGVAGSVTITGTIGIGAQASTTVPAYGRILASQPVATGSYTDSLIITVNF
jgi:spore coat protein U-like protein